MRIITGRARGARLKTLEGLSTRPTSERVKEAVFSMIQFDIEGREVLDLFAGSGQMGLEAISRGAASATLVDSSKEAIRIIEDNAKKTRLENECIIRNSDCMDFIRRSKGKRFDVIFIDPPYASGLYKPVLKELLAADMLKKASIIVCESDCDELIDKDAILTSAFRVRKTSRYSKTVITVLELAEREEA